MAHEIDKERLSAFLDGELGAPAKAELLAHLSSCPDCSAYLEKIKRASADFKKHGTEQAQAKGKGAPGAHPFHKLIIAFTVAILVIVAGGILAKKFAPGVFGQLQGMISGAAGNLGQ